MKLGDRLGRWVLLRELGSGGNATVWLAIDEGGNEGAVKVLRRVKEREAFARFRDEIGALKN